MRQGRKRVWTVGSAVLLASLMAGCKPDAAVQQPVVIGRGTKPATPPVTPPAAIAPGDSGAVSGTVSFHGKLPTATIDTSMDPACSMGGASPRLPVEQIAAKDGKLANAFLYLKSGPAAAMSASGPVAAPVVMDQRNCRYLPHVVAVMQGQFVEFRNSDPTMHNIHTDPVAVGDETIDISQGPRGQPVTKQFSHPVTMLPVRCNNHPWMSAYINVSATPFFAVSDGAGRFEMHGMPPGTYVLGAVHEKLGEQTVQITVVPGHMTKANFSFPR